MEETVTYKIFGIPIWTVTRKVTVTDEEAVYQRLSDRFAAEMKMALDHAKGVKQ